MTAPPWSRFLRLAKGELAAAVHCSRWRRTAALVAWRGVQYVRRVRADQTDWAGRILYKVPHDVDRPHSVCHSDEVLTAFLAKSTLRRRFQEWSKEMYEGRVARQAGLLSEQYSAAHGEASEAEQQRMQMVDAVLSKCLERTVLQVHVPHDAHHFHSVYHSDEALIAYRAPAQGAGLRRLGARPPQRAAAAARRRALPGACSSRGGRPCLPAVRARIVRLAASMYALYCHGRIAFSGCTLPNIKSDYARPR